MLASQAIAPASAAPKFAKLLQTGLITSSVGSPNFKIVTQQLKLYSSRPESACVRVSILFRFWGILRRERVDQLQPAVA
jgi:hypothetical protein